MERGGGRGVMGPGIDGAMRAPAEVAVAAMAAVTRGAGTKQSKHGKGSRSTERAGQSLEFI